MSDKSYEIGLTVVGICAIIFVAYAGFSYGQLDGLKTAADIKREQESRTWYVETMMRPLWDDYCKWFPEKCKCVPKPKDEVK